MDRCNCENSRCKHELAGCTNPVGKARMSYVGKVCDDCIQRSDAEYVVRDAQGNAGWRVQSFPRTSTPTELAQQQGFMPPDTYDVKLADVKITDREVVQVFQTEHGHQFTHRIKLPIAGVRFVHLDTGSDNNQDRPPTQGEQRLARAKWAKLLRAIPGVHESLGRDPDHQQELALAELLATYSEPPAPGTVEGIRVMLRDQRPEKCDDACLGWFIGDSDSRGVCIMTCDECVSCNALPLYDEDVEQLPEAQLKLAEEIAEAIRDNFLGGINRLLPPRKRLEVTFHGFGELEIKTLSGETVFGPGSAREALAAAEAIAALMSLTHD